jgi:hypothetical protein
MEGLRRARLRRSLALRRDAPKHGRTRDPNWSQCGGLGGPGEVLVSGTVEDLSGLRFEDHFR